VNPFQTPDLVNFDAPSFGRGDKAEILYEENALLINCFRFDALQFGGKRLGIWVSQEDRQHGGADSRPVMKLNLVRLVRCSQLPPSFVIQQSNR
jgi:hypothetical protein